MILGKYKHFSDINPFFYSLSLKKETLRRNIKDMLSDEVIAKEISSRKLPNLVFSYSSNMIKRGAGVDPVTQENKAVNIKIANKGLNGLIIHPGETFSFWRSVGHATKRRGFKEGRVLQGSRLVKGTGGGLCNLANTINQLILHSPLEITEFHTHSDALAPDEGERKPLANGTSVCYNSVDYRFKNNLEEDVQLLLWCEGDMLCAELRSEKPVPYAYELFEEDHHFEKQGEKYYRISKIYKLTKDKTTGELLDKKLIVDNHSEVLFDPSLIPKELIR